MIAGLPLMLLRILKTLTCYTSAQAATHTVSMIMIICNYKAKL